MYQTATVLRRRIHVRYPAGAGRMLVRTELDWDLDIEPIEVSDDGEISTFELEARKPFVYLKPMLRPAAGPARWTVGPDMLLLMTSTTTADVYPCFEGEHKGTLTDVLELASPILGRPHLARVYLPPGYHENPLRRFPVIYMQDGKNLFFPEEAFLGRDWQVDRALGLLDAMSGVDHVIVVGVYSADRMNDYTQPGYEAYARADRRGSDARRRRPDADVRVAARKPGCWGRRSGGSCPSTWRGSTRRCSDSARACRAPSRIGTT